MSAPSLLQNVSQRHELWWQFTVRAVEMRHRGSYLGVIWTVLNPLLMLALYVAVFGFIYKSKFNAFPQETPVDYALAVFVGLVLFHAFTETMVAAPTFITTNPNLVKKVVFPLEILPLANVSAAWFHASISLLLLLLAALVLDRLPSIVGVFWILPIFLPAILLCIGTAWLFSALGVFFRDISQVTGFASQVVMWCSAVFIPVHTMQREPWVWAILRWNPLLQTIEAARRSLLWNLPVDPWSVGYTWLCGLGMFFVGLWFFRKTQPAFADVI